ncbi:MAG: hypothetical protein QW735_02315 [archaeon]
MSKNLKKKQSKKVSNIFKQIKLAGEIEEKLKQHKTALDKIRVVEAELSEIRRKILESSKGISEYESAFGTLWDDLGRAPLVMRGKIATPKEYVEKIIELGELEKEVPPEIRELDKKYRDVLEKYLRKEINAEQALEEIKKLHKKYGKKV